MDSEDAREFDIIIFGASSFVGCYAIEELANSTKKKKIKWAVAGRNVEKLKSSLQSAQNYLEDVDILNSAIIKADVEDETSLSDMCKRAKLILNCVGPYNLHGEPVVSACIRNGTHHIDLCAELKFLETTQARYFNAAREKGIYLVQACGFASIPGDYGVALLAKKFPGDMNAVEYYVETKHGPEGAKVHTGTFVSVMGSITDYFHIKKYNRLLKNNVFRKDMMRCQYRLHRRWPMSYSKDVESVCAWYLGPEERIVKRSQMFRYEYLNERPVQCYPYVRKQSLKSAILAIVFGAICAFLSLCSFGLRLLIKYPSLFSVGTFTTSGPTREQVERSSTKFTLIGKGWQNKVANLDEEHKTKPDTKMKLTITGPEPAYAFTSICLVQAGLTVLEETDKMPLEGGVLTPGAAFENTTLSERLEKRGVAFTFENIHNSSMEGDT